MPCVSYVNAVAKALDVVPACPYPASAATGLFLVRNDCFGGVYNKVPESPLLFGFPEPEHPQLSIRVLHASEPFDCPGVHFFASGVGATIGVPPRDSCVQIRRTPCALFEKYAYDGLQFAVPGGSRFVEAPAITGGFCGKQQIFEGASHSDMYLPKERVYDPNAP